MVLPWPDAARLRADGFTPGVCSPIHQVIYLSPSADEIKLSTVVDFQSYSHAEAY